MKWKFSIVFGIGMALCVSSISANEYNCGRIKDNWPPPQGSTGTTCKLNVQAGSPQEAFNKCTVEAIDGTNCCTDNVVHKNIKGLGIIKGNQVTHIACPGK